MNPPQPTRRTFLKFVGTLVASMGGISLSDIQRAEAAPTRRPPRLRSDAAECIRDVLKTRFGNAPWFLRLGIEANENGGFRACMGWAEQQGSDDIELISEGIPIVVQRDSWSALSNIEIVLGEWQGRKGFWFHGPLFEKVGGAPGV